MSSTATMSARLSRAGPNSARSRSGSQTGFPVAHTRFAARPDLDREQFLSDYAALGALNIVRILGVFARLTVRDGKPRYATLTPRMWSYLDTLLVRPDLAPLKAWMDRHAPAWSRL